MRSYLGKRGYVIIKKMFDEQTIQEIKKELTVQPYVNQEFSEPIKPFKVFLENEKKLYLPKYYGYEKFGNPDKIELPDNEKINLSFSVNLRPHQIEPFKATMETFDKVGGGILSLPCGEGKTALGCKIIAEKGEKTLVLVHQEFLLNQWIERIMFFLPGARIGKIQGKTVDIKDKDIVLGMIQSISMKDYEINIFDSFGFVILDEAHRCPSREFSKALRKINSKYMLGLSATPNRKDGLTKVLKWFVGDVYFLRKGKGTGSSIVERYIYDCTENIYCEEKLGYYGKINSAGMINQIAEYFLRTKFIWRKIEECLQENRIILVLADRKDFLKDLEGFAISNDVSYGYYIGGMKRTALEESAKKDVIFATFQMAQEGLDISTIDTIILATPKTEIEQAVGRIRPKVDPENEANTPLVIDIVDDFSMFSKQALKRYNFYKTKNYYIETFKVDKNGENQVKLSTYDPNDKKPKKDKKKKEDKPAFAFSSGLE